MSSRLNRTANDYEENSHEGYLKPRPCRGHSHHGGHDAAGGSFLHGTASSSSSLVVPPSLFGGIQTKTKNRIHHGNDEESTSTCFVGPQQHRRHDASYYRNCLVGGILSSTIRWVLTPVDAIKCNMQVHPHQYPTFTSSFAMILREQGWAGLYRGFLPTVLSYSSQTGTKYVLYEFFKDNGIALFQQQHQRDPNFNDHYNRYKSIIYIASAGCAEAIADVLMCPWEMLKVQVQTATTTTTTASTMYSTTHHASSNVSFPTRFGPALQVMIQRRHELGFPFGSLGPLWSRQILGTMANFYTFETTVEHIYTHVLACRHDHNDKESYPLSTQLSVTLAAGYLSGLVSTVVSHPADSLISLKARFPNKSFTELIQYAGWKQLALRGLGPRMILTGSIIGFQWLIYDAFKSVMGMGTTGGK